MKRLLAILATIVVLSLTLMPYSMARAKDSSGSAPPIEQPLVREGDFAVEIANTLKLTTSIDEAEAENSLASVGIAPRNGWIPDYPMTPDIVAEVQDSVGTAADAGKLAFSRDDALRMAAKVSTAMDLPIRVSGGQNNYSSSEPPSASDYLPPATVEDYYYDYGPPVVSYYPPPWDYWYLYSWVPWPFWWGGWGFGGFFVLNNFDRVVAFRHGHRFHTGQVSNIARTSTTSRNGAVTTRTTTVDPATRTTQTAGTRLAGSTAAGTAGTGWNRSSGSNAGFANSQARQGATSILNRSLTSRNGLTGTRTAGVSSQQSGSMTGSRSGSTGSSFSTRGSSAGSSLSGRDADRSSSIVPRSSSSNFGSSSSGAGTFHSSPGAGAFHGSPSFSGSSGGMGSSGFHGGSFGGSHAFAGGGGGFHGGGGGGFHGGGGGMHR